MIIEISIAIIAVAFLILVIFLVTVLLSLRETLKKTSDLTDDLREMTENLHRDLSAFDPYFRSVADLGELLEEKSCSLKKECSKEQEDDPVETIKNILALATIGIGMWQKFKQRRD